VARTARAATTAATLATTVKAKVPGVPAGEGLGVTARASSDTSMPDQRSPTQDQGGEKMSAIEQAHRELEDLLEQMSLEVSPQGQGQRAGQKGDRDKGTPGTPLLRDEEPAS
jgi:hypothetical protein